MSWETLATVLLALVAVGSLLVNATQARSNVAASMAAKSRDQKDLEIKGRAQDNADDAQVLATAKVNIEMLEKQNELLIKQNAQIVAQGEQREADWRKREDEWHRRERKLEDRVDGIDKAYKELVVQVQELGVCVRAHVCKDFDPAGRREGSHEAKVGGTT